jgi:hypothetical protein
MMRTFTTRLAAPALLAVVLSGVAGCGVLQPEADPAVRDETTGEITESSEADVFSLKVGDCFNAQTSEDATEVSSVPTVPCSDPHDNEAYAAMDMPAGDYPGDQAVSDAGDTYCYDEFEKFVGMNYDESALDLSSFFPTAESWAEGDLEIMCFVSSPDGQVTGTLAGAAR